MLKSFIKVLQIEGEGFLCLPLNKADFPVRAELKKLSYYYNQGFSEHRRSRGSSVRPRHYNSPFKKDFEAAHPALDRTLLSQLLPPNKRGYTSWRGSWITGYAAPRTHLSS